MKHRDDDYEDFSSGEVPDDYCPFHPDGGCRPEDHFPEENEAPDRALTDAHASTVAALDGVLDVEAGLAEILNRNNDTKEK
ncbi:hypothetical protein ACWELB_21290 [Streptomyces asiaticus]